MIIIKDKLVHANFSTESYWLSVGLSVCLSVCLPVCLRMHVGSKLLKNKNKKERKKERKRPQIWWFSGPATFWQQSMQTFVSVCGQTDTLVTRDSTFSNVEYSSFFLVLGTYYYTIFSLWLYYYFYFNEHTRLSKLTWNCWNYTLHEQIA